MKHRIKTKPKPVNSGRSYSEGYLSRSQIGAKLGIKGFSWHVVQKAMRRAGYLKYDSKTRESVPTDKAAGLHLIHEDINEETGQLKTWPVWSPTMVDILREDVAWVLANPRVKDDKPNKPMRVYPEGFLSVSGFSLEAGTSAIAVSNLLIDCGYARRDREGKLVPADDECAETYAYLFSEERNGKVTTWYIWSLTLLPEITEYVRAQAEREEVKS